VQTKTPRTDLARAFAAAADELMTDPQLGTAARDAYPELALWETARPT
jgi:hypothetical protein